MGRLSGPESVEPIEHIRQSSFPNLYGIGDLLPDLHNIQKQSYEECPYLVSQQYLQPQYRPVDGLKDRGWNQDGEYLVEALVGASEPVVGFLAAGPHPPDCTDLYSDPCPHHLPGCLAALLAWPHRA